MVKSRLALLVLALVLCGSSVEARGRRSMQQPMYYQYYNTVPAAPAAQPAAAPAGTIVQTSAVEPASATSASNSVVTAGATTPATAAPAAVGSAQWKAEQSARMCSVAHIGGGFGGGSYEGNGYGATAQQAIQNCCFWGQRTPIEIGVARGANGYYATVFYR